MQTKPIFILKAFALSLTFIMRFTAIRKWPIQLSVWCVYSSCGFVPFQFSLFLTTFTTTSNTECVLVKKIRASLQTKSLRVTMNTPFPSCCEPHYESEAKCKPFNSKISFHLFANNTNFQIKNGALSLALIMRFKATRKGPSDPKLQ